MATYLSPPPHERLNVFFGEFFRELRKAPPQAYGEFWVRAEEEFRRLGYRDENSSGVENILIVRLDLIGDMVLTSGFLREVRANFPKARITLVVESAIYSMVELCPYVNEVLSLDRNFFGGNFVDVLERIATFCRENLWQKKISIAFSPRWHDDTFPHLMLAWMSGARERIGYDSYPFNSRMGDPPPHITAQDNFFLTKKIVTPKEIRHDAEKNFYLLEAAGFKVNERHMELWYSAEDLQHAREILKCIPPSAKKILLGLGARQVNRKYPVEMYLVALRELAKKDIVFVIVGGHGETAEANFIEQNLPTGKVLNLAGKTTLRESEAIVALADCYVGNVTGTMHMAAAQIPVLTIYREAEEMDSIYLRGSEYERFAPYKTKAIVLRPARRLDDCATLPLVYGGCHHREPHCITQIPPQQIVACFEKLQTL